MDLVKQRDDLVVSDIIRGAGVLFEKYGLRKTTMEDIAREVGKGKSSLYYYFPSKFEIFEAVIEQETREFFQEAEDSINHALTAIQKLKAYSRARFSCIRKLSNLSQVARNNLLDNPDLFIALKKKYELRQAAIVKKIIATGIGTGEFKPLKQEEIDSVCFVFLGIFRGESMPLCMESSPPHFVEEAERAVDLLVQGIGR